MIRGSTLPNGLELRQLRVPLGVIGIIYEGRPNVTVDAAALCLKSGNAILLRGSSSAYDVEHGPRRRHAGRAGGHRGARGSRTAGSRPDPRLGEAADAGPRPGGRADPARRCLADQLVVEESTVPVIETGVGNCHVYVDADADHRDSRSRS